MKIVIEIPEEEYKRMKEQSMFGKVDIWKRAIKNGTLLPEHHGRLISADAIALIDEQFYAPSDYYVAESAIKNAPTIIEGSESE